MFQDIVHSIKGQTKVIIRNSPSYMWTSVANVLEDMIKYYNPVKSSYAREGVIFKVGDQEVNQMTELYSVLNPVSVA